jgi:hypothetical protein
MSKIIIQLQGGLVQEVFIKGTGNPTKAIVVDEDVEGAEDNDPKITSIKIGKDTYKACIHIEAINELPKKSDVDRIVTKYLMLSAPVSNTLKAY